MLVLGGSMLTCWVRLGEWSVLLRGMHMGYIGSMMLVEWFLCGGELVV